MPSTVVVKVTNKLRAIQKAFPEFTRHTDGRNLQFVYRIFRLLEKLSHNAHVDRFSKESGHAPVRPEQDSSNAPPAKVGLTSTIGVKNPSIPANRLHNQWRSRGYKAAARVLMAQEGVLPKE